MCGYLFKYPCKYEFKDEGIGWQFSLVATRPLSSEIKRKLIDITEILEKLNQEDISNN